MSGVEPELVERMVALVRALSDVPKDSVLGHSGYASEARSIVADLPKPVDPDLAEARETAASFSKKGSYISISAGDLTADHMRAGIRDDDVFVQAILAAIKRGRDLQKQEQANASA